MTDFPWYVSGSPQRSLSQFMLVFFFFYLGRVGKVGKTRWEWEARDPRGLPRAFCHLSHPQQGGVSCSSPVCFPQNTWHRYHAHNSPRGRADAWLVVQGQHRTDARSHNSDLLGQCWTPRCGDSPGAASLVTVHPSQKTIYPIPAGAPLCLGCYRAEQEGRARI